MNSIIEAQIELKEQKEIERQRVLLLQMFPKVINIYPIANRNKRIFK